MNFPYFTLRSGATFTLAALLAVVLAACAPGGEGANGTDAAAGSPGPVGGTETATVSGGTVEITADNIEFNVDTIEAPAGETWTVTLVNNDSAPHNFSIYTEEGGEEIVIGDIIDGGETTEVEVPALDAGEYFFVCDVHPNEMTGTVVVG